MIAYSPLEPVVPPPPVQNRQAETPREETEMNYVVMAFIIGVIILAITDTMRGLK
jgi:hypothetical protein